MGRRRRCHRGRVRSSNGHLERGLCVGPYSVLLGDTPARQTKYVDLHGFNSILLIYVHIDHAKKPHVRHIAPEACACSSGVGRRTVHAGIHAVVPVQGFVAVAGLADAVVRLDHPVVLLSVPLEWALAMLDGHYGLLSFDS